MPYFKYSPEWWISFYWEVPSEERVCEVDVAATSTICVDDGNAAASMSGDKGETSSSSYKTKYEKLPRSLKSCLDYCAFLDNIDSYGWMREKKRVVRLMVAEGLIEDKAGETDASSLEDIASSFIDELVSLGMLTQRFDYLFYDCNTTRLDVLQPYRRQCVIDGNKKDFDARNVDSPIRVFSREYGQAESSHHLKSLPIQSLFLDCGPRRLSQAIIDTIFGLRSLLVLALTGTEIAISLNEGIEHVNLRYLGLEEISRDFLPILGKIPHLRTWDSTHLYAVPEKVSHIKTLRHLPRVDARCDNIGELSSLTQLRSLRVDFVAHENIDEILQTIMSMKSLTSLSMQAEEFFCEDKFIDVLPLLEPFSPPPLLQELQLKGTLIELPIWIADLKNLISLDLIYSNLTEISSTVLQHLPKLKHLHLFHAYEAKLIGKDFCTIKGFPKLETLVITSKFLIEWTEIAVGGFPCLKLLQFNDCKNLMFLPEGLQNIFTLQELSIDPAHGDLIRRLNGDENYKIKHIPSVELWE